MKTQYRYVLASLVVVVAVCLALSGLEPAGNSQEPTTEETALTREIDTEPSIDLRTIPFRPLDGQIIISLQTDWTAPKTHHTAIIHRNPTITVDYDEDGTAIGLAISHSDWPKLEPQRSEPE